MRVFAGTTVRIGAFVAVLAVVVAAGFGLGRLVGPVDRAGALRPADGSASMGHDGSGHDGAPAAVRGGGPVGGLAAGEAGYRLVAEETVLPAGEQRPWRFRIVGPDGAPVRRYATAHDRPMHLIVARRDLSGYRHLHPTLDGDGTWSVPLALPQAGSWRAFADFAALDGAGTAVPVTLGIDLAVPGEFTPVPLPAPASEATVDGYTVTLDGAAAAGRAVPLRFTVRRDGADVAPEPYLGAFGHLVVLRQGDLAYVHAHADERPAGSAIRFSLTAPTPGTYRMFLDFQAAGTVHTAEYTFTAG